MNKFKLCLALSMSYMLCGCTSAGVFPQEGFNEATAELAKHRAQDIEKMNRENRKAELRDELETRAWGNNISRPHHTNNTIVR